MSLNELTRNAFQSGLPAPKWLSLCKLFIPRDLSHASQHEIEAALSNSVLVLYRSYPGDTNLQAYLKYAIHSGMLSLAVFIPTFLSAARSQDLHNTATLDVLCKTILECHYTTGLSPLGSIVPFGDPPILGTIQECMELVRVAHNLPSSNFHQLTTSASNLLVLLLSTVTDFSHITTPDALVQFAETSALLHLPRLPVDVRHVLENYAVSLSLQLGDEAKAAREAQMMHTLQLVGKGDIPSSISDRDNITCSLLLSTLVRHRSDEFGSGDGEKATVVLIAFIRFASWTPSTFYMQLFNAAMMCLAQESGTESRSKAGMLWRAFIVGRLPHLLAHFEKTIEMEGMPEADWRAAMHIAMASLTQREDLLQKCDAICQQTEHDNTVSSPHHMFMSELLHGLLAVGLIDQTYVVQTNLFQTQEFHSKIQAEAQDHGQELEPYLESKLTEDISMDDISSIIEKVWRDPSCHSTFATSIHKRFISAAAAADLESLGHLSKVLYTHEHALEIISLHVKLTELLAHALAVIEDYDCESVGDPQTAVSHIGNIVLFVQIAVGHYQLGKCKFVLGDRTLDADMLSSATIVYRVEDLKGDDAAAFTIWHKALFDSQSEGIEDSVLRSTKLKSLMKIAGTVLSHAIQMYVERKLERSVLENGIQYFLGPLLIWTVGGVIKALLTDMKHKIYWMSIYTEVVQLLLNPSSCPQPILGLLANIIVRTLHNDKPPVDPKFIRHQFDPTPVRKAALTALGSPAEGDHDQLDLNPIDNTTSPVVQTIRNAILSATTGQAPSLDINRCLRWTTPIDFLSILWAELSANLNDLEMCRRIARYVLTTPQPSRSPPLLPVFLHLVLPTLIASADRLVPPAQTVVVEMLVSVVSDALTSALYIEWAVLSTCKEQRLVLGQPALAMARRLGGDLRRRPGSPTSAILLQRLTASSSFIANFPTFTADF
ncbi:hypothetical protein BDW22DRAFT_1350685 [Trametopsis cervina]|nr:hypothetical protein BDW22DRAFT_1350685 [Trametopsis cervina]